MLQFFLLHHCNIEFMNSTKYKILILNKMLQLNIFVKDHNEIEKTNTILNYKITID